MNVHNALDMCSVNTDMPVEEISTGCVVFWDDSLENFTDRGGNPYTSREMFFFYHRDEEWKLYEPPVEEKKPLSNATLHDCNQPCPHCGTMIRFGLAFYLED